LEANNVAITVVGMVLFALAFVVLLVLRGELEDSGREWWMWSALAGVGLSILGNWYVRRRADAIARARALEAAGDDSAGDAAGDAPSAS
jgi:hypothetical protein